MKLPSDFKDIFLLFLPNFLMNTPIHFLLFNNDFEIFNNIVKMLESQNEFFSEDTFLEKILNMFIFILENVQTFHIIALKRNYSYLTFDPEFSSSDDDDDDDDSETEKLDQNDKKEAKNSFSSNTRKNIYKMEEYFEKIFNEIQKRLQSNENLIE